MTAISNGGPVQRVKVLTDAHLKANGGDYYLEGRPPVAVYGVVDADTIAQGGDFAVMGNVLQAVYVVDTPTGLIEGNVPIPMIGVDTDLVEGLSAIPVYVVGGVLGLVPPLAPANLTAIPTGTNNLHVLLDWDAPADTDEYDIEYSTDGVTYAPLTTVTAPTTTYTHTTPTWGVVAHYYQVRGVNAAGDGAWATMTIADLLLGLVAGWSMNALSGDETNLVSGGGTAVDVNGCASTSGVLAGARTSAVTGTKYMSVATNSNISMADGSDFTVAAWARVTTYAATANPRVASKVGEYLISLAAANAAFFISNNGTAMNVQATNATAIAIGNWYLVVGRYDHINVGMSVNGSAFTNAPSVVNLPGSANSLVLNARDPGSTILDGDVDQPLIYKRALSATNIATLYNSGAGLAYPFS